MDTDNAERDFLHGLATPLGTAVFLTDSMIDRLKNEDKTIVILKQLKQISKALNQMRTLLQDRRDLLPAKRKS